MQTPCDGKKPRAQLPHAAPAYPREQSVAALAAAEGLSLPPHPGRHRSSAGGGQRTKSPGGEDVEGAHQPGLGRRALPPGQTARSEGQGTQDAPAP